MLFVIEMTKTIVVPIDAETVFEAFELAESEDKDTGFDGAWDRAEAELTCIDSKYELDED